MDANTLTLKALFQKDVRYVIPTFQRPYVWNQDDQWEPLWNDVRNTAERYLDELELVDGSKAVAEERTGTHFMGAVVVQQQMNASAELETRMVIDGQQRLTTTQIRPSTQVTDATPRAIMTRALGIGSDSVVAVHRIDIHGHKIDQIIGPATLAVGPPKLG